MSWACGAYNRTATVANPGKPQTSLIPFLKPGYNKYKRISKTDPKTSECFYLVPVKNRPRESKRRLVYTGKLITIRNVTWAHVHSGRSSTTRSKPSVEGKGNENEQDRKASAADSDSVSEHGESEAEETTSEVEMLEA